MPSTTKVYYGEDHHIATKYGDLCIRNEAVMKRAAVTIDNDSNLIRQWLLEHWPRIKWT